MQTFFSRIAQLSIFFPLVGSLSLGAQGQTLAQNRIVQAVDSGEVSAIPGTVHPMARSGYDRGPVAADLQLHGMTLDFKPSASQKAALDSLVKEQQDPASPSYRKWLTTAQYADRFGMTQADLDQAAAWLLSQGFTIDKVAESRNTIWFSGVASQAEAAFHTKIRNYSVDGETHFANATEISLPTALAGTVVHVGGLSDFRLKPHMLHPKNVTAGGVSPEFTSGISGGHTLAPGDFAVIYDVNPLYSGGFTGTGQTIGIVGQTDIVLADITAFRSAAGLPVNNPTVFLIPGSSDPGISYNDLGEADLDLEWSGGVAQNASIVYINSSNVLSSLQYAIANKINGLQIPILSMSYGGCETQFSSAALASLEGSLEQANSQGQTVINSSGDSGAAACDDTSPTITSATNGLAVNYPASSAFVTGLGGSEFTGDGTAASPQTGAGTYWNATGSTDLITSAKSYIPEMAWNDTAFAIAHSGGLSAGGGGVSTLFAKPVWQSGVAGIPGDGKRDVPDISLNSSADHDPYLYCTQIVLVSSPANTYSSSCANGFRVSDSGFSDDQGLSAVGGTSVAAPAFAGLLALIEQKLGTSLGNINPTLYTLASNATTYTSAFHDITTGDIIVPCTPGTPAGASSATICPSSGQFGYSAGAGYDLATGLGSVDGDNLATAYSTVAVKAGTTTSIVVSPATPVVGTTATLTATVAPNSGATAPTGTVTFTVDGTAGTPVAMTDGVATTTTNFSTGGTHTVVAAYSGDANYYSSTTTSTFTVAPAATAAPTSTAVAASPTSIALGNAITLTASISSATAGTLAGSVTFTTPSGTIGTAPVVAGASGSGTATLSVSSATTALGFSSGTDIITATYGGDSSYASSSGTATITVTNPGLTLTVGNITVPSSKPGNTGSSTLTVTSTGGYSGTVDFSATAATLNAQYDISPPSVVIAGGASGTATVSIQTIAAAARKGPHGNLHRTTSNNRIVVGAAAGAFGAIFLLAVPGFRRKRWPTLTALLLLSAMGAGIGCGGGGVSSGASPSGTYTVTVTATDSGNSAITTSTNFTMTIQ